MADMKIIIIRFFSLASLQMVKINVIARRNKVPTRQSRLRSIIIRFRKVGLSLFNVVVIATPHFIWLAMTQSKITLLGWY